MSFQRIRPDVYQWSDDRCHVYVIKDSDKALLIDLGDGAVLDALPSIGVAQVEWVLFTHHHREQCRGYPRLAGTGAKCAGPDAEKSLFERPSDYRKMKPTLGDAHSVYGSSYVRPPLHAITLDQTFTKMDSFTWRGRELWCVDTRGQSPGGMSYLLPRPDGWLAFTGDAMLAGARLHTWFDSEWDYGFGKGLYALANAAGLLADYRPALMLPSHGPIIREPARELALFQQRLRELARHYLRGYDLFTFAGCDQDRVSRPTSVPHVWQISPHLYKFKGPDFWPNFTLLLADSGKGLIVDCGLFPREFLDRSLRLMRERLKLKQIDVMIVTHMHGDHCLDAPYLRDTWGAKLWTLDRVADHVTRPERYNISAPINTYGKGIDGIAFDRILRDGETFTWEGFTLTADWMPGQTEFALCLHGEIDGRKVAFTGDNIFGSATDPKQTGHEAVVAHNSCLPDESYLYAADYLHAIAPDLLIGGHSWVIDQPTALIERYREGALALREAFRALCGGAEEMPYRFDPFWVRAEPYRLRLKPGESAEVVVHVRNFRPQDERHTIVIETGEGVHAKPGKLEGAVPARSVGRHVIVIRAEPQAAAGVRMVSFDVSLDGRPMGPWFDMIVEVSRA